MRAGRAQLRSLDRDDSSEAAASPITNPITSKENQWLNRFRAALAGDSGQPNVVGIEGPHLIEEAMRSGVEIIAVLVSATGEKHLKSLGLPDSTGKKLVPRILRTNDRLFAWASDTQAPQGVAALVRLPEYSLEDVARGLALVIVPVGVQDPGNVGTLLRSAEALGATGLVATAGTADPYGPKAMRASAGSAFRLPILRRAQPPVLLAQLRVLGVKLIAATAGAGPGPRPRLPRETDFRGPFALLVGSEAHGLPEPVLQSAGAAVSIPLAAPVESLNAAVAASVILYEAARQRAGGKIASPNPSRRGAKP